MLGRILTETPEGAPREVTSFSQREINESRIWYEHTKVFTDLAANDSFVFDVGTEFAEPLLSQVIETNLFVHKCKNYFFMRFFLNNPCLFYINLIINKLKNFMRYI